MARFPAGVQFVTVTFGSDQDFSGAPVSVTCSVTPSSDVVWGATGQRLVSFLFKTAASAGAPGSVQLPVVDQDGWQDGNGNAFTQWAYTLAVTYQNANGSRTVPKQFQPLGGQSTVDFDLIPTSGVTLPISGPIGVVTSWNGQTGAVEFDPANGGLLVAANLADLADPAAARANLGLGDAAIYAAADFDPAGAAAAVTAASIGAASTGALTTETTARTAADSTLTTAAAAAQATATAALPKAGGTMTGAIAMGAHKVTGLSNGTATDDAAAFGQLASKADLASPALTGTPTAPTPAVTDNSTKIATTAFVRTAVPMFPLDAYGGDPTGAANSDTAMTAAIAARGSGAGIIALSAGTYKFAADFTSQFDAGQGVVGQGSGATTILPYGSGNLLHIRMASFDSAKRAGRFEGFTIDGTNAGASARGINVGDMGSFRPRDINIKNFTGASAIGFYAHNINGFMEKADVDIAVGNNTQNVVFDGENGASTTSSFDYSTFKFRLQINANQDGIVQQKGAVLLGCDLHITYNAAGGSSNTGCVWRIGSAGETANSGVSNARVFIAGELNSGTGTVGPTTIINASTATVGATGSIKFNTAGTATYQSGTNSGTWNFAGPQYIDNTFGKMAVRGAAVNIGGVVGKPGSVVGQVVNLGSGNIHRWRLTSGNNNVSFESVSLGVLSGANMSGCYDFEILQPASGSAGTITWPTITWLLSAPTLSATNNAVDVVRLITTDHNTFYGFHLSDPRIANALQAGATLDQLAAAAADVSLGSHKITNLAAGSAASDAVRFDQVVTVDANGHLAATILPAAAQRSDLAKRSGAISESFSRLGTPVSSQAALTSGDMTFVAIPLVKGQVVTNLTFVAGATALVTGTNQWFGLWSPAKAQLGLTSDDTSTAWAASTEKTLALASPYTVPSDGLYYASCMVKATTVPSLLGVSGSSTLSGLAPLLTGQDFSHTGLTNPASAPSTAAISAQAPMVYCYAS